MSRLPVRSTVLTLAALGAAAMAPAAAGELTLSRLTPNPYGVVEELYGLSGPVLDGAPVTLTAPEGLAFPAATLGEGEARDLRILHFNDLHNYLTKPHGKKGDTHVFAQMVRIAAETRATAEADDIVLFLSAGDDHTGGVFDELTGFTPEDFVVDPAYTAYTVAGVDATVLGNHEFDRGTEMLATWIESAPLLPVVSANTVGSPHVDNGGHYFPALIAVAKGLRIGILGLTTAEDTRLGTPENPGLEIESPLETVEALLPALADKTDVVILLTHLGYGAGSDASGKAGAMRRIGEGDSAVAELAGSLVDSPVVLVGGHTHTVLNADGLEEVFGGVPVLQAGGHGSHLGEFRVSLTGTGAGASAGDMTARLHALKKSDVRVAADDPKYATLQQDGDWDAGFERLVIDPLRARLDLVLQEQIATIDATDAIGTEATVANRYIGETAIANLMNDLLVARTESYPDGAVDIAAFNATGLVQGVPASGPLTFADWFGVMPFTDSVQIFEITGADILAMLDSNAKRIVRPAELESGAVDLSGYVSRGFLHFSSGLRYTLVLNEDAQSATVRDVTINGTPVEEVMDETFRVAFGSYIGNGGFSEAWNGKTISGGVPGEIVGYDLTALPKRDTGFVYRNEIVAEIREAGTITPDLGAALDGRLSVVPE
ncbi:5'-nucleotidase C-terminal domain-containing protein [uncultured Rhodospira sp.]|uniref:bifunctional metallophosphatase/5'-nucleotidase n=1 Tax=uncultured Rhodospira sp. TaxID=1936189 RepID=UPI00260F8464|nr:5'-nucleotidase C-terminal domain-containing protein [uncultured Rhodospira sp.]